MMSPAWIGNEALRVFSGPSAWFRRVRAVPQSTGMLTPMPSAESTPNLIRNRDLRALRERYRRRLWRRPDYLRCVNEAGVGPELRRRHGGDAPSAKTKPRSPGLLLLIISRNSPCNAIRHHDRFAIPKPMTQSK